MIVEHRHEAGLERPDSQERRDDERDPPAGNAGRRHQADIRGRHRQPVGAEQAGNRRRDAVGEDAAANRIHLRANPVGIGRALVGRDHGGDAHRRRQAGDGERNDQLRIEREAHMRDGRERDQRLAQDRHQIVARQQAGRRRRDVSHDHADEDAEQPELALVPDVQSDHHRQREAGDGGIPAPIPSPRSLADQDPQRGQPDDDADQEHHQARGLRRDQRAQLRPHPRQRDLDQPGEDRHAPQQRQAAGLHRQQRRREIDAGEDRRRQKPAADRPARQRLQQHRDSEREHAHPQHRGQHVGRSTGLAADDQRIDHEDRDHADVLDGADQRHQMRRRLLDPVDEIGGLPHVLHGEAVSADARPP